MAAFGPHKARCSFRQSGSQVNRTHQLLRIRSMCRRNGRSCFHANPESTQTVSACRALNMGRTISPMSETRESKSWPIAAICDRRNVNFSLPIETHRRGVGAFILYRLKLDTGPANLNWPRAEMRQDLPRVRVAFGRESVGTGSNFGGRNRASHSGPPQFCNANGLGLPSFRTNTTARHMVIRRHALIRQGGACTPSSRSPSKQIPPSQKGQRTDPPRHALPSTRDSRLGTAQASWRVTH